MGEEIVPMVTGTEQSLAAIHERLKEAEIGRTTKEAWGLAIALLQANDLLYERSSDSLYLKESNKTYYKRLDEYEERQLVLQGMRLSNIWLLKRQQDEVLGLIRQNAQAVVKVDSNCIMISENLYWDKKNGSISPVPTGPVFFRLFDNKPTDATSAKVLHLRPFTEEQEERFMAMYEQVKGELERGEEVERFEPFKVWADGSHDVYMDLHRAHAYCFLQKKPLGAYLLTGLRRNGKSTYLYLTHSIVGTNNTSKVKLTDLNNPRQNLVLGYTLMNAPDEEKDEVITGQDIFKTITDHGSISLDVFRSQKPVDIACDFMCFFPMNHVPEWKGAGAGACMRRSLIIPFTKDLSEIDDSKENFLQETFTEDFMCEYLGSVFAYAYFYHRHDFDFSKTMREEQDVLEGELDSTISYVKLFQKWFTGFSKYDLVFKDYRAWCRIEGVPFKSLKELKNTLNKMMKGLERKNVRIEGEVTKMYVATQAGVNPQYFYSEYVVPEFKKTIDEIQGGALNKNRLDMDTYAEFSVIERLENWEARNGWV